MQAFVEYLFAGMAKRRVAYVMRQRECFDEVLVEPERAGNCAGDRGNLECMGQSRAMVIAHVASEDLCLATQAAKRRAMNDPISIALKGTSIRMPRFGMPSSG